MQSGDFKSTKAEFLHFYQWNRLTPTVYSNNNSRRFKPLHPSRRNFGLHTKWLIQRSLQNEHMAGLNIIIKIMAFKQVFQFLMDSAKEKCDSKSISINYHLFQWFNSKSEAHLLEDHALSVQCKSMIGKVFKCAMKVIGRTITCPFKLSLENCWHTGTKILTTLLLFFI